MDQAGRIHGNTTTTTTITETHVQTNLRFDPSYVKTIPGALKLAAVVRTAYSQILNLISLILPSTISQILKLFDLTILDSKSDCVHLWSQCNKLLEE